MKKLSSVLLVAGGLFVMNVQKAPFADNAKVSTAKTIAAPKGKKLKVNTSASTLGWIGTKPSGKHNGSFAITSGNVQLADGTIKGGEFVIDMNSLTVLDLTGKGKEGLEGHLKAPDFFDVAKNPISTFAISDVAKLDAAQTTTLVGATHTIAGNLTMHGVTKNISFPAIVTVAKKKITAVADFNIDRTEWGMSYGADGKVAKEVNLKLNLVAGK